MQLITAKLTQVSANMPSSPDSSSDSSTGSPGNHGNHYSDGPNPEVESCLPGVVSSRHIFKASSPLFSLSEKQHELRKWLNLARKLSGGTDCLVPCDLLPKPLPPNYHMKRKRRTWLLSVLAACGRLPSRAHGQAGILISVLRHQMACLSFSFSQLGSFISYYNRCDFN